MTKSTIVRKLFKVFSVSSAIAICLNCFPGNEVAVARSTLLDYKGPDKDWAYQAATTKFPKKPLTGMFRGTQFKPVKFSLRCPRSTDGSAMPETWITLIMEDAQERRISVTITLDSQYENAQVSQTEFDADFANRNKSNKASMSIFRNMDDQETFSAGQFGLNAYVGNTGANKLTPCYLVMRRDKKTWVEGYFYATNYDPWLGKK